LQAANRELARTLRRRAAAYALWLLFPVGAHRFYLAEALGGLVYVAATVAAIFCVVSDWTAAAVGISAVPIALAAFDLWWIDRRVTEINKRLRMKAYLRPGGGAPPGFAGRPTDLPGAAPRRPLSFIEQERILTEIGRAERDRS
jgi:TM2 domain-containing membrane protein YozV